MKMNICGFSCSAIIALTFSLLCIDSVSAQVNLIVRQSTLNTSDFFFDGSVPPPGQFDFYNGFGTYNQSQSNGSIQASQTSSIINDVFDVQTFGRGGSSTIDLGGTEGFSIFTAQFEVLTPSSFTLVAELFEEDQRGIGPQVTLSGGNINLNFFPQVTSNVNTLQVNTSGVLQPSVVYTFEVASRSLGEGASFVPVVGPVSANAILTVTSVPEPSTFLPAMILAVAGAFRRRRSVSQSI